MLNLTRNTKHRLLSIPIRYFSRCSFRLLDQKAKNIDMKQVLKDAQDVSKRFQYPFETSIPVPQQTV